MGLTNTQYQGLMNQYQDYLDAHIAGVGKTVMLFYPALITITNEDYIDPVRDGETKLPDFAQQADPPTETRESESIKAHVYYSPKDFNRYDLRVNNPNGIIKVRSYLSDIPKLMRAEYIVPDYEIKGIINNKYKILREPVPVGFKEVRYAVTYWELS